jgi:hypothetical protein
MDAMRVRKASSIAVFWLGTDMGSKIRVDVVQER